MTGPRRAEDGPCEGSTTQASLEHPHVSARRSRVPEIPGALNRATHDVGYRAAPSTPSFSKHRLAWPLT
jgi:hypothetical protein